MWQYNQHSSSTAIDFSYIIQERPSVVSESFQRIMAPMSTKELRLPQPLRTFKVSEIEEAFRYLQSGQNAGKAAVEMNPEDQIEVSLSEFVIVSVIMSFIYIYPQAVLDNIPRYSLPSNATYVIAGGLGGLARSAAKWSARREAKNLILLCRSGPRSEPAVPLIQELEAMGLQVKAPRCDVGEPDSLSTALAKCTGTMPPIKGVTQGAVAWRLSFQYLMKS